MSSLGFPKQFDNNVAFLVAAFLTPHVYKFHEWVYKTQIQNSQTKPTKKSLKHLDKMNWCVLSESLPISLLTKFKRKIVWQCLARNQNAIELIENHVDKVFWCALSANPKAIHILEKHKYRINFHYLCSNINGMNLLLEAIETSRYKLGRYDWMSLCDNPNAIPLLKKLTNNFTCNTENVRWPRLSLNPNAIEIIVENFDKIEWWSLSQNLNLCKFMEMLNPSQKEIAICKLDWYDVSMNPNAIELLVQNFDKVCWQTISCNVNIMKFFSLLEPNQKEIAIESFNWSFVSRNPNAVPLLEQFPSKIDINSLCKNENAIHLLNSMLNSNPDAIKQINWIWLSSNSNAIHLLEQHFPYIDWLQLCWKNKNAHLILQNNLSKINWIAVSQNCECLYEFDWELYNLTKKAIQNFIYNL